MQVLEALHVAPGDDQVHSLGVLDLEVADGPTIGTDDAEAQLRAPATRKLGPGQLQLHAARGDGESRHAGALSVRGGWRLVAAVVARIVPGDGVGDKDSRAEHEGHRGDDPDGARRRAAVDAGLVHHRMALSAGDQVAVDRHRDHAGDDQRERERAPEEHIVQAGVHRAGNDHHDEVVDDLHRRDAQRVRRESDGDDGAQRQARPKQRQGRQAVTEQERQRDGQRDGGEVRETQRGADRHAGDFADRAAGQAVQGGRDGDARKRSTRGRHLVVVGVG